MRIFGVYIHQIGKNMRNLFLKTIAIGLFLLVMPMKQHGQQPRFAQNHVTIDFDITEIANFDERIVFLYNLVNDSRFNVVNSERDGIFIVSADPSFENMDLQETFAEFREQNKLYFSKTDKETLSETAIGYKSRLPQEFINSLMMDIYVSSRQNNYCNTADPFCTDNGLYQFPAGVNAGSGEGGPAYGCLSTRPNPAWYYMRIGNPGSINIYMYSTPSEDIDFCCWGPFEDPIAPCPSGLTQPKIVSCSYSANPTENCMIPSNAQTGQYYILVITNFSNHPCNITFSKTSGNGTTDCGIMPPAVSNNGPYCIGQTITLSGNAQGGATYSWSGPGGWSATGQTVTRPNCTMAMAGTYTCTISLNGQTNSANTQVEVYAMPTANFTATTVCQGNPTQFNNTSTTNPSNQPMTYQWSFGDNQTSTEQNPVHQYASAGNYTVTLSTSCGGSCTSTKTQTVSVLPNPVADAGEDQTVIYGATATLSGSGGSGAFNYHWEPANKVVNPNSQTTRTVELTETTTFTLTVSHPQNNDCASSDQVSVLVEGSNMTATASASPTSICEGDPSQLQATAVGGTQNYSYQWTPTLGLSAPNIANPIAHPSETTTYTCIVSDGMSTQTVTTTVTVNHPEYSDVEQFICPGESYNFYGQDYSEEGNYDYITTTAQGCEKIITLHLHHHPSYPNVNTLTEYICPGTSYNFHGDYYHTEGLYSKTYPTVHGCDSTFWLDLKVYPTNDTIIVDPTICTSQTYNFHGTEYYQDGDIAYFDTIDNNGCLLVEKLILSVGPYQMPPIQNQFECYAYDGTPSYYWDKTGRIYTQDTYTDTILPDPEGGCDIKYRLNLKFHQAFYQFDELTVCDNYEWPIIPGSNYTSTDHHLIKTFSTGGGSNFNCDSTYVLDLTVNHKDISDTIVNNQCDRFEWQFGWNNENYVLTSQGDYTKTINTYLGCDSIVTLRLQLDYSPTFERVEGKSWVVGGSEFQYTVESYWIETHPLSTHSTEWSLYKTDGTPFNKWEILPYDNGDKCLLYIYTFERDSIELRAHTQSTGLCECGEYTHSKWIHCGYYEINENIDPHSVDIYPNPNDGNMTLAFENMEGETLIKVYNIAGTLIDQLTIHNEIGHESHTYKADRLTPGIYFFNIINKKGILTKKVIVID